MSMSDVRPSWADETPRVQRTCRSRRASERCWWNLLGVSDHAVVLLVLIFTLTTHAAGLQMRLAEFPARAGSTRYASGTVRVRARRAPSRSSCWLPLLLSQPRRSATTSVCSSAATTTPPPWDLACSGPDPDRVHLGNHRLLRLQSGYLVDGSKPAIASQSRTAWRAITHWFVHPVGSLPVST